MTTKEDGPRTTAQVATLNPAPDPPHQAETIQGTMEEGTKVKVKAEAVEMVAEEEAEAVVEADPAWLMWLLFQTPMLGQQNWEAGAWKPTLNNKNKKPLSLILIQ